MAKPKRPNFDRMSPEETLAWLKEQIGAEPFKSLRGLDTDESLALSALGLAKHAKAKTLLVSLMERHPDFRIRLNAANALLCFDDKKLLNAVAAQLDFEQWDGGPLGDAAVAAIFKLSPKNARKKLARAFELAVESPESGNGVALSAWQHVYLSISPPRDVAYYEARNIPIDVLDADRKGWLDECHRQRGVAHNSNQRIPMILLFECGDERWLDDVLEGLSMNGVPNVCRLLTGFGDARAAPRLRELAKGYKGQDKARLLETADELDSPPKKKGGRKKGGKKR